MNIGRMILAILAGIFFSAVSVSILSYINSIISNSSTPLGPASDFWRLAMIVGAIIGAVIGGVSSTIIVGFKLNIWKAAILGAMINLVIGYLIASAQNWDESSARSVIVLTVIGLVNGAFVALINYSPEIVEL